jgi:hypothetical protein
MQHFFKLAITGTSQEIERALNAVDDRLVRDGGLKRGSSCFRFWKVSKRHNDGTLTSYYSTYQAFAADWLNRHSVSAEIIERG